MTQIDIVKASTQLTSLLARAIGGEEILITKDDQPIVKLVPMLSKEKRRRQPGSAKDMVTLSDDFDEPIADFEDYLQ